MNLKMWWHIVDALHVILPIKALINRVQPSYVTLGLCDTTILYHTATITTTIYANYIIRPANLYRFYTRAPQFNLTALLWVLLDYVDIRQQICERIYWNIFTIYCALLQNHLIYHPAQFSRLLQLRNAQRILWNPHQLSSKCWKAEILLVFPWVFFF